MEQSAPKLSLIARIKLAFTSMKSPKKSARLIKNKSGAAKAFARDIIRTGQE